MRFFKTWDEILAVIEYSRTAEGSWRAEFHGFADVSAEATTLEKCRHEILDKIDLRLAELAVPRRAGNDLNNP